MTGFKFPVTWPNRIRFNGVCGHHGIESDFQQLLVLVVSGFTKKILCTAMPKFIYSRWVYLYNVSGVFVAQPDRSKNKQNNIAG